MDPYLLNPRSRARLALSLCLLSSLCLASSCRDPDEAPDARLDGAPDPAALAIEHATVLSMVEGSAPLPDHTVIVRDRRIVSVAPASQAEIPADATRVNAAGKWLMPALTDMHVHVENDQMMRLLLGNPDLPDSAGPAATSSLHHHR